jgi:uncharacterized protein YaaQ
MESKTDPRQLLMLVIAQDLDADFAKSGLERINLTPSNLPSVGGFLARKNTTLLVGCSEEQFPEAVGVLKENCHQRIEFMMLPMDNPTATPMASPLPVSVGGATIFTIEVEYQEEIP